MKLDEIVKMMGKTDEMSPVKGKSVSVVKISPLEKLAEYDSKICPECKMPIEECECEDDDSESEEGGSPEIMKLLKVLGIELPSK